MLSLERLLPALVMLMVLAACGARWQSLKPHTGGEVEGAGLELGEHHGHRDLPGSFDKVWGAASEALHKTGIGVPRSVAPNVSQGGNVTKDPTRLHLGSAGARGLPS